MSIQKWKEQKMIEPTEIKIPAGYKLREGVIYSRDIERFLWRPESGDLFYSQYTNKVYEYIKWEMYVRGLWMRMDGYAKIKELGSKNSFYTPNLEVRKCIPIEKVD